MMAKDPLPDLNGIDAVANPAVVGLGAQTGIKIKNAAWHSRLTAATSMSGDRTQKLPRL